MKIKYLQWRRDYHLYIHVCVYNTIYTHILILYNNIYWIYLLPVLNQECSTYAHKHFCIPKIRNHLHFKCWNCQLSLPCKAINIIVKIAFTISGRYIIITFYAQTFLNVIIIWPTSWSLQLWYYSFQDQNYR